MKEGRKEDGAGTTLWRWNWGVIKVVRKEGRKMKEGRKEDEGRKKRRKEESEGRIEGRKEGRMLLVVMMTTIDGDEKDL